MTLFTKIIGALLLLASGATSATEAVRDNPYTLMNWVADQAFSRLADIDRDDGDQQQQLEAVVVEQLMPYIDHRYAAFSVLGKHLKKTNKAQRERFANAFKAYLIETYTQALQQYKQQQVQIENPKPIEGRTKVTVKAQLLEDGRPPIKLSFKFRQLKSDNTWLAYDLIAEGVSLLSTKRSEFDSLLRTQDIDEITNLLEQRQLKGSN